MADRKNGSINIRCRLGFWYPRRNITYCSSSAIRYRNPAMDLDESWLYQKPTHSKSARYKTRDSILDTGRAARDSRLKTRRWKGCKTTSMISSASPPGAPRGPADDGKRFSSDGRFIHVFSLIGGGVRGGGRVKNWTGSEGWRILGLAWNFHVKRLSVDRLNMEFPC